MMLIVAIAVVRAWTRLYTGRMDPVLRDARRAEIDSDLWEFQEDARHTGAEASRMAAHVFARLLLGMPADLLWRLEHADGARHARRSVWVAAAAAGVFVTAFWMLFVLGSPTLPPPPPRPSLMYLPAPPPPPPPPPPMDAIRVELRTAPRQ